MTPIVATIAGVRAEVAEARRSGKTIALVPTMGALHEGHASLIRAAGRPPAFVVVSIFVNPTQFGPSEDFARYPRTLEADQRLCTDSGTHLIFAPAVEEMYPEKPVASVEVAELPEVLCGAFRPGHFRGVCTVVLKLFNIVGPDVAIFGEKDFQQSRIIRRMVRDLDVPVEIRIEPTVREADGLALSSRNRYLSLEQRAAAPKIYRALEAVRAQVRAGETDVPKLEQELRARLEAIPGARVQYASIVDADSLRPPAGLDRPAVAAVAVYLGETRLIDNITLP